MMADKYDSLTLESVAVANLKAACDGLWDADQSAAMLQAIVKYNGISIARLQAFKEMALETMVTKLTLLLDTACGASTMNVGATATGVW